MKKLIAAVVLASILAVIIGTLAYYSGPGYVVFSFAEYTLETSFVFMAGFAAFGFFVFYYLVRILSRIVNLPHYISNRHHNRQLERSKNTLIKGLIEISEGRFEQAEKMLIKHAEKGDSVLLSYLMAARAAQQLAAYERRDEYLRRAHESTPSADIAIGLTQAELQLSHQQYEQALATLNHLSAVAPKHGYVKKLLAYTFRNLGDWESLSATLAELKKLKAMDRTELDLLEVEAYSGMLQKSIKQVDGEKTEVIWGQLPKPLRHNIDLTYLYASYLQNQKKDDEAEALIRNSLAENWDNRLALLYSNLHTSNARKQLETAEIWLHAQPRNAELLLVLGKLCLNCEFWGKARTYFETSISIQPLDEAYLRLAELLETRMDAPDEAQKVYKSGLKISVDKGLEKTPKKITSADDSRQPSRLKLIQ